MYQVLGCVRAIVCCTATYRRYVLVVPEAFHTNSNVLGASQLKAGIPPLVYLSGAPLAKPHLGTEELGSQVRVVLIKYSFRLCSFPIRCLRQEGLKRL